ncbi:MAG: hypothetical protein M3Y54_08290 [Bacteroidota bacterium]|nr:hypothetical protein [Bacteroidota bacterium]
MLLQIQQTANEIIQQLPSKIGVSLLTTLIVFLLTLLSKQIRQFLFYKRHEFEFQYDSDFRGCEYDVQWEELRLTVEVGEVHNDYLSNVIVKRNAVNPGKTYEKLEVSNKFIQIPEWSLYFKLNSIVRTKPQSGVNEYQIYFVLKRRR